MTTALSPSPESRTDSTDRPTTVSSSPTSSWYDPDSSAWEPRPAANFEALRASPARPARIVEIPSRKDRSARR
jgi:hypothetical protein